MSIVIKNQVKIHRWVLWFLVKKLTMDLNIKDYIIAGSYRRGQWWCNDIDLLVPVKTSAQAEGLIAQILSNGWKYMPTRKITSETFSHQFVKSTGAGNLILDLFLVPPGCMGNAMLFTTGPKSFNDKIRKGIIETGYSWANPKYFTHIKSNKELSFDNEKAAMKFLGIHWISPSRRR